MLRLLPRSDLPVDGVVIQNSESVNIPSSVKQDDERAETAIDRMGKRRRKARGETREIQRVHVCLCVSWDGRVALAQVGVLYTYRIPPLFALSCNGNGS